MERQGRIWEAHTSRVQVSRKTLAWALGLGGAIVCTIAVALTAAAGLWSAELLLYPTFIAFGVLGALVASRQPANSIGWLMCCASLLAVLLFVPLDYGYAAQVTHHGAWPLGGIALWFAGWGWIPLFGLFLPAVTVRFPDGLVPPRWRVVDWLALAGTVAAMGGVALAPRDVVVRALLLPQGRLGEVAPVIDSPLASAVPEALPLVLIFAGLGLILLAYVASVVAAIERFRHARGDERLQLTWFAYAGVLIAVASIYGSVTTIAGGPAPVIGEVALHAAFFALPFAIAIAILRYRLYDIALIINRTLVYGGLTAIVAAFYAAVVALGNRFFISASGQKSDAAYFVVAFVVVVSAYPFKDWLQRQVDRRVPHRSPSAIIGEFSAEVEAVVSILDVKRVACRLLDQAVSAFDATGAALYLDGNVDSPAYSQGRADGAGALEVDLRHDGRQLGRLVLGGRRGDLAYTRADREALQRSADLVGEALALVVRLGESVSDSAGGSGAKEGETQHRSRRHPDQQAVDD
jgi:hypothetical protein